MKPTTEFPVRLDNPRAWRTYLGGRMLDALHGDSNGEDGHFPEEWILSTVAARNAGREQFPEEGMSHLRGTDVTLRSVLESDTEGYLGKGGMAGLALAKLCYETLMADGVKAKVALEKGALTPAVEHIIEANTLLSGIGFESSGLAAAHAIHNGLTMLPECHGMYHGEKVAFGTIVQLVLEDAPTEKLEEVLGFCIELGLPVTMKELGVAEVTREQAMVVAEAACAPEDTMCNMPFEVTPEMVANAILGADALGHYYLMDE